MPDWNEANRDEFGFPLTKEGSMKTDTKLKYLLDEILAIQKRIQSLEDSIGVFISKLK